MMTAENASRKLLKLVCRQEIESDTFKSPTFDIREGNNKWILNVNLFYAIFCEIFNLKK